MPDPLKETYSANLSITDLQSQIQGDESTGVTLKTLDGLTHSGFNFNAVNWTSKIPNDQGPFTQLIAGTNAPSGSSFTYSGDLFINGTKTKVTAYRK